VTDPPRNCPLFDPKVCQVMGVSSDNGSYPETSFVGVDPD